MRRRCAICHLGRPRVFTTRGWCHRRCLAADAVRRCCLCGTRIRAGGVRYVCPYEDGWAHRACTRTAVDRRPFPVTDPDQDASDGSIVFIPDPGRTGWWARVGMIWYPVEGSTLILHRHDDRPGRVFRIGPEDI